MTTSFAPRNPPGVLDEPATPARPLARAILGHALLVGLAADLLLRRGPTGLGMVIWMTLAAGVAVALVWRDQRPVPAEARAWLVVAILCTAGIAWRDAGLLQLADLGAAVGALVMAAVATSDATRALFASRMRDTMAAGLRALGFLAAGPAPLLRPALADVPATSDWRRRLVATVRAAAIGAALLVVFGGLLASADPLFAAMVQLPDVDVRELLSHALLIGFFGWMAAGWGDAALLAGPGRRPADRLPFALSRADVTTALGTLTALFALYVVAQAGWLFGGERFLRERVGLTAAQYARHGFFEMTCVVALALPVLLVTRAAMPQDPRAARRHTALALPIIALLALMVTSAALRMRLYVQYFGLTTDRIYPMVFMGWLAFVLVWLAATVLRGRGRSFVAGAIVSGALVLAALHVVVPDVIVARVNTNRASSGIASEPLDAAHLGSLGGDAVPVVVDWIAAPPRGGVADPAAEHERCVAARRLLQRWGAASREAARQDEPGAWRSWNAARHAAVAAVARNAIALRRIGQTCSDAGRRG
jgi:hypothetical protein